MPRSSNRLQPSARPVGVRGSSRQASSSTQSSSLVPEQLTQLTNVVAKPTAAALAQQIPCLSLFDHAGSLYAGSLCWLQHRPAVEGGALRRTPSCTASSKRSATSGRRSPSCCPAARRARPETAGPASARPPLRRLAALDQAARATCAAAAGFRRRATTAECRQRSSPCFRRAPLCR